MGVVWLLTAVAVIVAVGLLAAGVRRWWIAVAVAAVAAQVVIATSWADAKAGTLANLILLAAAVYGFAAYGPLGLRAEYRRRALAALARPGDPAVLTEADLAHLPEPVAAYVRRSGAVGQPRVNRSTPMGPNRAGCSSWTPPCSTFGSTCSTPTSGPMRR